ncbi:hypothetical protein [Amycolatopsis sp. Hca4]|uniref:hypothetical protein n=1 Tax=Amycolatopsis sp. Hca4 TaxID=2742131 RepID=UPI00159163CD|nr:hypothetical protein [Amycolatopsis sp. Hca4]QKV74019.1 hypothetical protein HUT10_09730 [Amycolatopsis sp. Hca4]
MAAGDGSGTGRRASAIGAARVPGLELAARLDRCAETLLIRVLRADDAATVRRNARFADGLCRAAEALRSADRGDPEMAELQLLDAVALLEEFGS